ncbi:hypothetical protein [Mucilaginibacter paludis]|uniref:hypothetical protein n=1 Tax=Mucilaginibacter paludis TaxID=423351 RepID=UPI0001E9DEFB|nr:hypothetical protein [Mucilaginibacter paludis]
MLEGYVQPRLRVFAGPNGSGKSTVIDYIRSYRANNKPVDFGYYINADDIATALKIEKKFSFRQFDFQADRDEFVSISKQSGLLNGVFSLDRLIKSFSLKDNFIHCLNEKDAEHLAQIIAD